MTIIMNGKCPVCAGAATARSVGEDLAHFTCPACTEFLADRFAVEQLSARHGSWNDATAQMARAAAPGRIYSLTEGPDRNTGGALLVGEYVDRPAD